MYAGRPFANADMRYPSHFNLLFEVANSINIFATTGVRTQEDCCPLELKSNALTTRP